MKTADELNAAFDAVKSAILQMKYSQAPSMFDKISEKDISAKEILAIAAAALSATHGDFPEAIAALTMRVDALNKEVAFLRADKK